MRNAETDLKNIRKVLKIHIEDFSKSIGMDKEQLIKVEAGERKFTDKEICIICTVLLNTIDELLGFKNDLTNIKDLNHRQRIENKRNFIVKLIVYYISNYIPMNIEIEDDMNIKKKYKL